MSTVLTTFTAGLLVAGGGALGAVLRHLSATAGWGGLRGILLVNVVGALGLGVVLGLGDRLSEALVLLLGVGLCGALTTYSTLAVQTWELWEVDRRRASAYVLLTTAAGLLAAALPIWLLTS